MDIHAPHPGWAEQLPDTWWENVVSATQKLAATDSIDLKDVDAIGISYQMHGLVVVDSNLDVLRSSIIWCDSRAVEIGDRAAEKIGREKCLSTFLNFPGNFTASKLAWVRENEPDIFDRVFKAMLPGDYLAMRLTGDARTTRSGLSEGIFWDYKKGSPAVAIYKTLEIPPDLIPDTVPTFGVQGQLQASVAEELGLRAGIPVSYRAGDQPNNALSLNVLNPGEIAATAGTSGVVYGVTDTPVYDPESRVNTFIHVNDEPDNPRYGVLLCINGTGILNSWLRNTIFNGKYTYNGLNEVASWVAAGSDGLVFIPYGNGAERSLGNRDPGSSLVGLNFNTHGLSHVLRSAQEGIVFAMNYGVEIMRGMGLTIDTVRAGHANMFLSPVFREAFANTLRAKVELFDTDGAQGAARGAGIGAGIFKDASEAFSGLEKIQEIEPVDELVREYRTAYDRWLDVLHNRLETG
jgi:xylulokinase